MTKEIDIMDHIIANIHAGKYAVDEKLPSENTLADHFHVPRMTVRKIYEQLQEMGYIYSKQGKGSFVKNRRMQIPLLLSGSESFTKKMNKLGFPVRSKNLFCEKIDFHKEVYTSLGVKKTEQVYKIGRLRIVDDIPIALHVSYVAKSVFPNIGKEGSEITSMFDYYQKNGYSAFDSKPSVLEVLFSTKYLCEVLACSSLIPLLVLETGCIDKKTGTVLEHTEIYYRSDCFRFVLSE